jgi:glutathione S-transferase
MLGERLMDFAQALVFEYNRPEPSQQWIERQSRKVVGGVQALERAYSADGRIAGDPLDTGDIAAATTLLLFDFIAPAGLGPDLPEFRWRSKAPALADAVERLDQRPSFVATRPQPMDVDLKATVRT